MSAENKNEAVASSDVSTRISQQLAELDEAYLHRAEKHIELLLAEKAAEAGDAEAQARCGDMYMSGNGESGLINRRKALFFYKKAAEQGNVHAQFQCGDMDSHGISSRDRLMTREWFEQAAMQGDAEAQCRCGDMYFQGIPGETDETDLKKAFDWYKKSRRTGPRKCTVCLVRNVYVRRSGGG